MDWQHHSPCFHNHRQTKFAIFYLLLSRQHTDSLPPPPACVVVFHRHLAVVKVVHFLPILPGFWTSSPKWRAESSTCHVPCSAVRPNWPRSPSSSPRGRWPPPPRWAILVGMGKKSENYIIGWGFLGFKWKCAGKRFTTECLVDKHYQVIVVLVLLLYSYSSLLWLIPVR